MQKLTIKGFLSGYVRYLSGLETNNISRLAKEAEHNHKLREPLFLYAFCLDKMNLLINSTHDSELRDKYSQIYESYTFPELLAALENENSALDDRFNKCYHSYVCLRDISKTYDRKKQLILNKIRELQSAKNITTYRIYTDLGLNGSNVNAFIKNGSVKRLSVDAVRRIWQYLESAGPAYARS